MTLILYAHDAPKSTWEFIRSQVEKIEREEKVEQAYRLSKYHLNRHDSWNMRVPPSANKKIGELKIAGFNIQTAWVTDSPQKLHDHPQYASTKRMKPIIQLILHDHPSVLALSELHHMQARDLRKHLENRGYQLVGYSSETQESIEVVERKISENKDYYYSEFVGFLFASDEVELRNTRCFELEKGEKHKRILVMGTFTHIALKVDFVVLTMHFDHLSVHSRQQSAIRELTLINELEKSGIPWFSIGDRNWFHDRNGEEHAKQYIENSSVCDFRDENEHGHFGPSGTYPGHLDLDKHLEPKIHLLKTGERQIEAETLDVGFRSRKLTIGVSDYAYSGEFDPASYDLLPFDRQGPIHDKNFISDHYYVGGIFRFSDSVRWNIPIFRFSSVS